MADQKLTDRGELSTSTDAALVHVVESGVSYQQTKSNLLKEVTQSINDIGVVSDNIYKVKYKLQNDLSDVFILVCGDSTGNETTEWVFRFFNEYVKTLYPLFSVEYHLYDDSTKSYSTISLQTGTGLNTLHIYNASLSGSVPQTFLGDNYQYAINNNEYDLLILNHGHNYINFFIDDIQATTSNFLSFTEQFLLNNDTDCGVLVIGQNPRRDDDQMTYIYETTKYLCSLRGFGHVDVFSKFIELSKLSTLYNDNIHPSTTGTDLYIEAITELWNGNSLNPKQNKSTLESNNATNYLKNGLFLDYVSGTPDEWSNSLSTITLESSIVPLGNFTGKTLKITDGSISQSLSANLLRRVKGKTVTFGMLIYVPVGQPITAGRFGITATGLVRNYPSSSVSRGGWHWKFLTVEVPDITSYLTVTIFGDSNTGGGGYFYLDHCFLVEGNLPLDATYSSDITSNNINSIGNIRVFDEQKVYFGNGSQAGYITQGFDNVLKFFNSDGEEKISFPVGGGESPIKLTGAVTLDSYNLSALNTAPASASATGTIGDIRITSSYIYVCTATDTWKRTALTTW